MKLKTRHDKKFRLCGESGPLDPSRSPYVSRFPYVYVARRQKLLELLDLPDDIQFLWCTDGREKFLSFEAQKTVEWLIEVSQERILGYVNEDLWQEFLETGDDSYHFTSKANAWKGRGTYESPVSILVAYPLKQDEILRWTLFDENGPVTHGGLEELGRLEKST